MMAPKSLQGRLGLSLGIMLTLLWIATASITAVVLRQEMDEVFDSALQETAQRLLPLVVVDLIGRDEGSAPQRLGAIRAHDEYFTYIVRNPQARILMQSHATDPAIYPTYDGPGFRQTATHRLYSEDAVQGSIRITVAEPLSQRAEVSHEIEMVLGLPILLVMPVTLLVIFWGVRAMLAPLRQFRKRLSARTAQDLSAVSTEGLPSEIQPLAGALNRVLGRLKATFEAERSFAANAAHEMRTPLAGAIAQAQRLRSETTDTAAAARAGEIETTLKRLSRLSERLMQLARAEGGRLRLDQPADLRPVARILVDDFTRSANAGPISLSLPETPVMSDLDPDAFGILCRNLIENAQRHGTPGRCIDVTLTSDGGLIVANDGPIVPPKVLARLTTRFERGDGRADGSGLGLAIVAAIAERIESTLVLHSPRSNATTGFEARMTLPTDHPPQVRHDTL